MSEIGHNNPPADPFLDRLRETHADIFAKWAEIEIDALMLPSADAIASDEDEKPVTAFVQKAKAFAVSVEAARKSEKDDFLRLGRVVDSFFNGVKTPALDRASKAQDILGPYRAAKAARMEAERLEREAVAKAAKEAREAEFAIEQVKAREQQEAAARAAQAVREASNAQARAKAEADMRATEAARLEAQRENEAKAALAIQEQEQLAAIERQQEAEKPIVKVLHISSGEPNFDAIRALCGLLGPYFTDSAISAAIDKAGKVAETPPNVPGVTWTRKETTSIRRKSA